MHDDQALRIVLELLIMGCFGSSVWFLKRDWYLLRPPYWRIVICALLLVVFGHALATLMLMTLDYPITPGTWVGVAFYMLCAAALALAARAARRR